MGYSVQGDLKTTAAIIVRCADDENLGAGNPSIAGRVAACIEAADAQIDAALRAHYLVPLSTAPALVKHMSADLALYFLMHRRGDIVQTPKWLEDTVAAHRQTLSKIQAGELDLGVDPVPAASSKTVATSDEPTDAIMTRDTLKDF